MGIGQCTASRGAGIGAISCKEEWHSWFEDCAVVGAPTCEELIEELSKPEEEEPEDNCD